jgi:hypothetical protein
VVTEPDLVAVPPQEKDPELVTEDVATVLSLPTAESVDAPLILSDLEPEPMAEEAPLVTVAPRRFAALA